MTRDITTKLKQAVLLVGPRETEYNIPITVLSPRYPEPLRLRSACILPSTLAPVLSPLLHWYHDENHDLRDAQLVLSLPGLPASAFELFYRYIMLQPFLQAGEKPDVAYAANLSAARDFAVAFDRWDFVDLAAKCMPLEEPIADTGPGYPVRTYWG